ncbi:hypothetical protein D3C77_244870 [compost metagenome]
MGRCRVCRAETAQNYTPESGWYSASCTECGTYKIDKQVMKMLEKGKVLNAPMMQKWIGREHNLDSNPFPAITLHTAVWAS